MYYVKSPKHLVAAKFLVLFWYSPASSSVPRRYCGRCSGVFLFLFVKDQISKIICSYLYAGFTWLFKEAGKSLLGTY